MSEEKIHYCAVCGAQVGSQFQRCSYNHASRILFGSEADARERGEAHQKALAEGRAKAL